VEPADEKADEDGGSESRAPRTARRSIAWRILLGSSLAVLLALLLTEAYFLDAQRSLLDRSFRAQSQTQTDWIAAFAVEHLVAKDYPALEHAIAEAGLSDEGVLSIEVFHDGLRAATFRRKPDEQGMEFRSPIKWHGNSVMTIGEVRARYSTAASDRLLAHGAFSALLTVLAIFIALFFSLRFMLRRAVIDPLARLTSRTEQEIAAALPESEWSGQPTDTANEIELFDQRFTALLEGLNRRDSARDLAERQLIEHRDNLERLIEERTRSLREAQEEAQRLNRAKSEFLAAASHDLRQPLQAIRLFHAALSATRLDEQQRRMTDYLSLSLNALGDLLNALLDISKLDAGLIKVIPEAVAVERIFEKIDAEFSSLARQKGLRFKYFFPQSLTPLHTDSQLLLSMLRNLIGNALKYTERGGVLVTVRQRGNQALVQVWDTGMGIAPEYHERIFDEYFQIGNKERDRAKGVGLGLSIVRRLSRLLGTEVRCRSRLGARQRLRLHGAAGGRKQRSASRSCSRQRRRPGRGLCRQSRGGRRGRPGGRHGRPPGLRSSGHDGHRACERRERARRRGGAAGRLLRLRLPAAGHRRPATAGSAQPARRPTAQRHRPHRRDGVGPVQVAG
jgi:signal transduction histidine kinase